MTGTDPVHDAKALRSACEYLNAFPAELQSLSFETYGRILGILWPWARSGQMGTLLANYPGWEAEVSRFDQTMTPRIAIASLLARMRALIGDEASILWDLDSRASLFAYDDTAMLRRIRNYPTTKVATVGTPDQVTAAKLWEAIERWSDSWLPGWLYDESKGRLELARAFLLAATAAASKPAGPAVPPAGVAEVWRTAVLDYLAAQPPDRVRDIAAMRLVLDTPPAMRTLGSPNLLDGIADITPILGPRTLSAFRAARAGDDLFLGSAMRSLVNDVIPAAATDDALAIISHAAALLNARRETVNEWAAVIDAYAPPAADELPGLPDFETAAIRHTEAVEALHWAEHSIEGPLLAAFADPDFAALDGGKLLAKAKAVHGSDTSTALSNALKEKTSPSDLVTGFSAVPGEDAAAVLADLQGHLSGFSAATGAAVDALAAIATAEDPQTVPDTHAKKVAGFWAEVFSSHNVDAVFQPWDLDEPLARVIASLAQVGSGRSGMDGQAGWSEGSMADTSAGRLLSSPGSALAHLRQSSSLTQAAKDLSTVDGLYPSQRILFPAVYAEHVRLWHDEQPDGRVASQARMRVARAADEFGNVSAPAADIEAMQAAESLLQTSITWNTIDEEDAEAIRDVLYGTPMPSNNPTNVDAELDYQRARLGHLVSTRGTMGYVVFDNFSHAGPAMDEALTAFALQVDRVTQGEVSLTSADAYNNFIRLANDVRARTGDYVNARRGAADAATALAAAAVGIGISLSGVGAPLGVAMVQGAIGAGVAAMFTRIAIEGPSYTSADENLGDFAAGAAEGIIDAAAGGAVGGLGKLASGWSTTAAKGTARTIASVGGRALQAADTTAAPIVRVLRPALLGAIEGGLASATVAAGQTALEQSTWERSWTHAMSTMAWRATTEGLAGAAFGAAFGVPFSALEAIGDAGKVARLYGWFQDYDELSLLHGLSSSELRKLSDAREALEAGDVAVARQLLGEAGFADSADVIDRLVTRTELEIPLRRAVEEFNEVKATLDSMGVDLFGEIADIRLAQPGELPDVAVGGASVRIEGPEGGPFTYEILIDPNASSTTLREELLHIAEIRLGLSDDADIVGTAHLLTTSHLDATWSSTPVADLSLDERTARLEARRAYLLHELRNQELIFQSYPLTPDGTPRPDLDHLTDAQREAVYAASENKFNDLIELDAIDEVLKDPDAWDLVDAAVPSRRPYRDVIEIDDPPFLTARRVHPFTAWRRSHPAAVAESAIAAFREPTLGAALPALLPNVPRLAGLAETTHLGNTIKATWRRRFLAADGGVVQVVAVPGVTRFQQAAVNATPFHGIERPYAHWNDIPDWPDHRAQLKVLVTEAIAANPPTIHGSPGVPETTLADFDGLADSYLRALERQPLGFVYGTPALRVFAYDAAYHQALLDTPNAVFSNVVGQLHHWIPLYLGGQSHLAMRTIPTDDGLVRLPVALVDFPTDPHKAIHRYINTMTVGNSQAGINLGPTKLRNAVQAGNMPGSTLEPGLYVILDDGDMHALALNGTLWEPMDFAPLAPDDGTLFP